MSGACPHQHVCGVFGHCWVAFLLSAVCFKSLAGAQSTCVAPAVEVGEPANIYCYFPASLNDDRSILIKRFGEGFPDNGQTLIDCYPKCDSTPEGYSFTRVSGPNQTLVITVAKLADAGEYSCQLTGGSDKRCNLIVTEVTTTPATVGTTEGQNDDTETRTVETESRNEENGGSNTGAIVGGIFGGLAGLALVIGAGVWWYKKKTTSGETLEKKEGAPLKEKPAEKTPMLGNQAPPQPEKDLESGKPLASQPENNKTSGDQPPPVSV